MDNHEVVFFGQKVGIILKSSKKDEDWIFLTAIKKEGEKWQQLSEGKTIKLNLREMLSIEAFLDGSLSEFNTVHKYKETNTQVSFSFDANKSINLKIGVYSKPIGFPETLLFKKIWRHLVAEKIEFATKNIYTEQKNIIVENTETTEDQPVQNPVTQPPITTQSNQPVQNPVTQPPITKNPVTQDFLEITGTLKSVTPKAILFSQTIAGVLKEIWIPKSALQNPSKLDFNDLKKEQTFFVKSWVIAPKKAPI